MEVMIAMGRAVQSVGGGCLEDEPFLAMRSGLCIVLTRMRRYRHYSVPKTRGYLATARPNTAEPPTVDELPRRGITYPRSGWLGGDLVMFRVANAGLGRRIRDV
jgi:hypothetical protein